MSRPNKHGVDKDGFIIEDGFFGDMDTFTGEEDTEPGNFTRTELRYTAEELVEELRESKNGSSVSVTGLLKECGYDISDYSKRDIKVLSELLLKLSKANKIKLTENVGCSGDDPDDPVYIITSLKWDKILNKLYNEMYLHEWKKRYENPEILDGTSWEFVVTMTNRRKRTYSGVNDYPPYWSEFRKIFREYTRF